MNVKVITRHSPSNYGSLLQSIATIKVIEKLGHHCEIIDYIREDECGLKAITTPLKNKKEWSGNIIKRIAYILLRYPEESIAEKKFDNMRSKHLKLTEHCTNLNELSKLNADIFMTGSDQVWGPTLNGKYDDAYFLSFVKDSRRAAYAASFGRTEFTDNTKNEYKQLLSKYDAIAVREDSAVQLLKDMDINCLGQVLDPTLLLTGDEWQNFIVNKNKIKGEYILVYQLHNNPALNNYAIKLSSRLGLPLYRVSPTLHQIRRGGKFLYLPDLGDFLCYIKDCTYFITDSFHGTAFALNFNKQFIEILPNNKTGSRNQSILRLTGLENRIINNFDDFSLVNDKIDYKEVNKIINSERINSINTLRNILK